MPTKSFWSSFALGHDGLLHHTRRDGFILCSMGRAPGSCYVDFGVPTCLYCIVRQAFVDAFWKG